MEKITAWNYSDDSKMMIFSGFKNGQSDLFLYSFLSRSFQNLTNDFYDDYGPIFLNPDQIVFSSNRDRDSLQLKEDFLNATPQLHYDLFLYEYGKKDPALLRVTNTPYADEYNARRVSEQQLVYLSDNDGMTNRYDAVFDSTISRIDTAVHYSYYAKTHALTDRAYSILEQDYCPQSGLLADISLKDKVKRIYFTPLDLSTHAEPSPTVFRNKNRWEEINDSKEQLVRDSIRRGDKPEPIEHGFMQVFADDEISGAQSAADSSTTARKKTNSTFPWPVATECSTPLTNSSRRRTSVS